MCNFFSLISDGTGRPYYFNHEIRKQILAGKLNYELDSHTSIAHYHGFKGAQEDQMNKYEYNPLMKEFLIDQINTEDDSKQIKKFCHQLNFKTIVPALIIKPIIHPFRDRCCLSATEKDIRLLEKWKSVGESVGDSVGKSVGESMGNSVGYSVKESVEYSVGNSVGYSVWKSIGKSMRVSVRKSRGNSVQNSVWKSVGESVMDTVQVYISSFFDISELKKYQPAVILWEKGLVPSYDGKTWRLHGSPNGKILWEENIK